MGYGDAKNYAAYSAQQDELMASGAYSGAYPSASSVYGYGQKQGMGYGDAKNYAAYSAQQDELMASGAYSGAYPSASSVYGYGEAQDMGYGAKNYGGYSTQQDDVMSWGTYDSREACEYGEDQAMVYGKGGYGTYFYGGSGSRYNAPPSMGFAPWEHNAYGLNSRRSLWSEEEAVNSDATPLAAGRHAAFWGDPHVADPFRTDATNRRAVTFDVHDLGTLNILRDKGVNLNMVSQLLPQWGIPVAVEAGLNVGGVPLNMTAATGSVTLGGKALEDGYSATIKNVGTGDATITRNGNVVTVETEEYKIALTNQGNVYLDADIDSKAVGVAHDGWQPSGLLGDLFVGDTKVNTATEKPVSAYQKASLQEWGKAGAVEIKGQTYTNKEALELRLKDVKALLKARTNGDYTAYMDYYQNPVSTAALQQERRQLQQTLSDLDGSTDSTQAPELFRVAG
jgi:DNA-binding transcriptional MerR regulator